MINLPNFITIGRLLLVPFLIVMITQGRWLAAAVCFVVAGVSDAVDGFIAKRFSLRTELGAYIDPLADKALLMSIYVTLAVVGTLPGWLAVTVVSRDVMIMVGVIVAWLIKRPLAIKPLLVSKVNTAAQIGFAGLVLGANAFSIDLDGMRDWMMALIAVLTVASAGAYLLTWFAHMNETAG
ncbi:MAG: CDP-alcohol phosphatidyltransferase family protein [Hyphomicrobiales bacterium]